VALSQTQTIIREVAAISMQAVGGWQVYSASTGAEAIATATAEQPDVILLDVMMPDLDGPTTFRRLQADAQRAISRSSC
jgi:CheY-like chemotaxis protein